MNDDSHGHGRRSIRYDGFDYDTPGAYYFTIVVAGRKNLFGQVADDRVDLSRAGTAVRNVWNDLPTRFPGAQLDEFIVMPNHVHGIVWLMERTGLPASGTATSVDGCTTVGAGLALPASETRTSTDETSTTVGAGLALPVVGTPPAAPTTNPDSLASSSPPNPGRASPAATAVGVSGTVPTMPPRLGDVIGAFKSLSAQEVNRLLHRSGPLWQRNYYERIIRDENELHDIRRYIVDNPAKWALDREYVE